jgi:hypothetical protein
MRRALFALLFFAASISTGAQVLSVNASATRQQISDLLYGQLCWSGGAASQPGCDPQFMQQVRMPQGRNGGDGATRYNWSQDSTCDGSDATFICSAANQAPLYGGRSVDQLFSAYKFPPVPTGTAPALVSTSGSSGCSANFTTTAVCTIASGIPVGHYVAVVGYSNGTLTLSVNDSVSNANYVCTPAETANQFIQICMGYTTTAIPANGTVTATISGNPGIGVLVYDASAAPSSSTTADGHGVSAQFAGWGITTANSPVSSGTDLVLAVHIFGSSTTGVPVGCQQISNTASVNSYGFNIMVSWTKQSYGVPSCSAEMTAGPGTTVAGAIASYPVAGSAVAVNPYQTLISIPIIPYISANSAPSKGSYPVSVYGSQDTQVTDGSGAVTGNGRGLTAITGSALNNHGTGCHVGDILSVGTATALAQIQVNSLTGSAINGYSLIASGNGYSTGTGIAMADVVGSCSGATLNITSTGDPNTSGIIDTNPTYNMVANSTTIQGAWLAHLQTVWGPCSAHGICWYQLDNEPAGWSNIHWDVFYLAAPYSQILSLGEQYASLIRTNDPTAHILGPSDFGPYGAAAANYVTSDPTTVYYLRNFYAYDQANGIQTLDYLDQHSPGVGINSGTIANDFDSIRHFWDSTFSDPCSSGFSCTDPVFANYVNAIETSTLDNCGSGYTNGATFSVNGGGGTGPATGTVLTQSSGCVLTYALTSQGGGYSITAGESTTLLTGSGSGLTLNITGLSPFNTHEQFITRMQHYIQLYYPALNGIFMSEWELSSIAGTGGANPQVGSFSMVDAMVVAEAFGVWGYYGLQGANFYPAPTGMAPGDSIAYTWRMFRNYDGAAFPTCADGFGDTSVTTTSSNTSNMTVYGATRSCDGKLTVLVINKTSGSIATSLSLSGFTSVSGVSTFTYSSANTSAIVAGSTTLSAVQSSYSYPAYSETMLVFTPNNPINVAPSRGMFADMMAGDEAPMLALGQQKVRRTHFGSPAFSEGFEARTVDSGRPETSR